MRFRDDADGLISRIKVRRRCEVAEVDSLISSLFLFLLTAPEKAMFPLTITDVSFRFYTTGCLASHCARRPAPRRDIILPAGAFRFS